MILDRLLGRFSSVKAEPRNDLESLTLATARGYECLFHKNQPTEMEFSCSGIATFNYEQKVRSRCVPYAVRRLGSGGEFLRFYLGVPTECSVMDKDEFTFLVDLREIQLAGSQVVDICREVFWEPNNPKANEVRTAGEIECKLDLNLVDKLYPWNNVFH